MSHTPGPWHVNGVEVIAASGKGIVWELCGREDERTDDANLIAAAPDLLAACKYISEIAVSWQPLTPGDISDVRRAIAKAEGR